jgi:thiol-disulfide isomerase/thioredoxin
VVNYWSKTCAPCRVEIPELNYLSEALAPFGITVLGVNFDDHDREQTMDIANAMAIDFPTLTRAEVERLNIPPPAVLPTSYILAPDNSVKAKLVGAQDRVMILKKLAELEVGA